MSLPARTPLAVASIVAASMMISPLSAAESIDFSFATGGAVSGSAAVADDGTIYAAADDGVLYAITSAGAEDWTYNVATALASSTSIADDGTIYVGSNDNHLYAFTPAGALSWSYETGGDVRAAPAITSDGSVVFGSRDNSVYALTSGGALSWSYETGGDVQAGVAIAADGSVYAASLDGRLYALTSAGSLSWSYATGAPLRAAPAIAADGTVYVGSDDNRLYAFSPEGEVKWSYLTNGDIAAAPVLDSSGNIYFGSNDNHLYAVDASGTLLWRFETEGDVCGGAAVDSGGLIYAASTDGNVYALSAAGAQQWSLSPTTLGCPSVSLASGGRLVVGGSGGIFALTTASGDGPDTSSPWPQEGYGPRHTHRATDTDGDGMVDWWENSWGLDPNSAGDAGTDTDGDGLSNLQEHDAGSDPTITDTDGDGLTDDTEVNTHLTDPALADSDTDGASDGDEVNTHGTDPLDADSDDDDMADGWELTFGLDPLSDDSASDTDSDGAPAILEFLAGTDPTDGGDTPTEGSEIFLYPTGYATRSSPTLSGVGEIYIGASDGALSALDLYGAGQWRYETSAMILASPVVADDGTIYAGALDENLYAISSAGALSWTYKTVGAIHASPAIAGDGTLYIGSSDGTLSALTALGALSWSFPTGGGIYGSPSVAVDGTLYFGSADSYVYALDSAGNQLWAYKTGNSVFSSPAIDVSGNLYIGSMDKRIYSLDANGAFRWRYLTGGGVYSSPAIGEDGSIYVGSDDGYLYALDSDGDLQWRYMTSGRMRSSPTVGLDGTIYVGSEDGWVYALNPDGTLRWSTDTGSPVDGSPIICNSGMVYVSSRDYGVVALVSGGGDGLSLSPWPTRGQNQRRTSAYLDSDGDGMGDGWETFYGLDPNSAADANTDLDGDGLTNLEEYDAGTDPTNTDSDGDGLTDGDEVNTHLTDPTITDSDEDGLTDGDEVNTHLTDPNSSDSDGDWMDDGDEVMYGFDPNDPADASLDADGDGFSNQQEILAGTDPTNAADSPSYGDTEDWRLSQSDLDDSWLSIAFGRTFTSPVLLHGVPNSNDTDPGTPRIRNLNTTGAEMSFSEWEYLDGTHDLEETSWMALEAGTYELPNGDLAEVGTFSITGVGDWAAVSFGLQFPDVPHVFTSVQTGTAQRAVTVRISDVTTSGLNAQLFEQEAFNDAHNSETIGYLAIYSETGSGSIDIDGQTLSYVLATQVVPTDWTPIDDGHALRVEEEQSYDSETNHFDETASLLYLDGHLFGTMQTTEGRDTATLRRFQRDTATYGVVEYGTADINDTFATVTTNQRFADPVVFVGPPTNEDASPGVVRIDALDQGTFDAYFQEWDYQDGVHPTLESVHWMMWEAGRYTNVDGSIIEAGTIDLTGTDVWSTFSFTDSFPSTPTVYLTVATNVGVQGVIARADLVTTTGFDATMFEQESYADTHNTETISYMAVYAPDRFGELDNGTIEGLIPFSVDTVSTTDAITPVFSEAIFLEEEQSANAEILHSDETLAAFSLDGCVLGQTQGLAGSDPFALRRRSPEAEADVEWGTVHDIDDVGMTVVLSETFTDPVVIARHVHRLGTPYGVVRVSDVGGDRFTVRFQAYDPAEDGAAVQIHYAVFEAGTGTLGGLGWEAGHLTVAGYFDPDNLGVSVWSTPSFSSPFGAAPVLLTAVMSDDDPTAVTTRVDNVTTGGFEVILQEAEVETLANNYHSAETVGWVAFDEGQGATADGRLIWAMLSSATHADSEVLFPTQLGQIHGVLLADMHTAVGTDAAGMRLWASDDSHVDLGVQEEQTVTAETGHVAEDIGLLVLE